MSLAYVFPPESRAQVKGLCMVVPGNRSWGLERLNREGGNTSTKIYYWIDHHLGNWRSILLEVSEMPCRILLRITHLRDHGRWKHLCMTLIPHWPRFYTRGSTFPLDNTQNGRSPWQKTRDSWCSWGHMLSGYTCKRGSDINDWSKMLSTGYEVRQTRCLLQCLI